MTQTTKLLNGAEWLNQGIAKCREEDYVGAIQAFDRALQCDSQQAEVYGHRCVARHRVGDHQGAIADCQQAAALYLQQGKTKEHQYALKMLQKLLS